MEELVVSTHVNRRRWMDCTSSSELNLKLSSIMEKFPCITNPELLLCELSLLKGKDCIENFEGKINGNHFLD